MSPDVITSLFQAGATLFICSNIHLALRDGLKGISIWTICFFTIWTYWGAYNWYLKDEYWSTVTNVVMGVAYTIWLLSAWIGILREKNKQVPR